MCDIKVEYNQQQKKKQTHFSFIRLSLVAKHSPTMLERWSICFLLPRKYGRHQFHVFIPLESQRWHRHLRHQRANKGLGSSSPLEGKNGWEKDTLSNGQIWKNLILLVIFLWFFCATFGDVEPVPTRAPASPGFQASGHKKTSKDVHLSRSQGEVRCKNTLKKTTTTLKSIRRETSRRYLHVFYII